MNDDEERPLIVKAGQLLREGRPKEAEELLLAAAQRGSVAAMVKLAGVRSDEGQRAESDSWMDSAEAAVSPGNHIDHLSLNGGYTLALGRGDFFEQQRRALFHMERAAEIGNVRAQVNVALHYWQGLNGCKVDIEKFKDWILPAIDDGDIPAMLIYAEYLDREKQDVPRELLRELERVNAFGKSARKLLRALKRRKRLTPKGRKVQSLPASI